MNENKNENYGEEVYTQITEAAGAPEENGKTAETICSDNNNESFDSRVYSDCKKRSGNKKYIIGASIGLIILIVSFLAFKSAHNNIFKYLEDENIPKAQEIYNDLKGKKQNKIKGQIISECKTIIKKYNDEALSYEDASGKIKSFRELISEADKYSAELQKLHDSKTAFSKAEDLKEKKDWNNAKSEYEKVEKEDKKHSDAQNNIILCKKEISKEYFLKAKELESKEMWISALEEYDKVTQDSPEEYSQAAEGKNRCKENFKNSVDLQLGEMYANGQYYEGLQLIALAEKHFPEDSSLKEHKNNFTEKKEEYEKKQIEQRYNTGITYDQLSRNPDDYKGKYVKFRGKVLQVQTEGSITVYRVGTGGRYYYDNVIYAIQSGNNSSDRILEDDMVTIKGKSGGLYTYTAVRGNSITIPCMLLESIER